MDDDDDGDACQLRQVMTSLWFPIKKMSLQAHVFLYTCEYHEEINGVKRLKGVSG